jgi:hypothetical protein
LIVSFIYFSPLSCLKCSKFFLKKIAPLAFFQNFLFTRVKKQLHSLKKSTKENKK